MQPLLIEIGVEEMPAGVSGRLLEALASEVRALLEQAGIRGVELRRGCTPRRLLLHAADCPLAQPDRDETLWGPPEAVAYKDGQPTPAAAGFAKKSGLSLDAFTLADKGDGKGNYLCAVVHRPGRATSELLAEALPTILRKLPSPKQMQWQDGEMRPEGFIRPIRWIVARLGEAVIPFSFAGVAAGIESRGHRIMGANGELDLRDPFGWLRGQKVEADIEARRQRIRMQVAAVAAAEGLTVVADEALVAEVADLTEWPVPILCHFDSQFLRLPEEVIRITLKSHQRCFITRNAEGRTAHGFVAVANLESSNPAMVAAGNARVVNARLSDAAFYFDRDPKESLEDRVVRLNGIAFQDGLGSVGEQAHRLRGFVLDNEEALAMDHDAAQRAAYLAKSDLTTGLVREFPELQGYMGGVYALTNGESDVVAAAIAEHYRPAGAEDALPASNEARVIAIAERIDKLLGYFQLGKVPTASADPFALRRAAIGLIRLLADSEKPVALTLPGVVGEGARQWNEQGKVTISRDTEQQVLAFIQDRLLGMAAQLGVSRNALDAALAAGSARPLWQAVEVARLLGGFADSENGQAVAAANKRIANILAKAGKVEVAVDAALFAGEAELKLYEALAAVEAQLDASEPAAAIELLATLRAPVDRFFDEVMVMAEDAAARNNRLALLGNLRALFLTLGDLSRL